MPDRPPEEIIAERDKLAAQVEHLRDNYAFCVKQFQVGMHERGSQIDALRKDLAEAKELHREMIAAQFAMSAPRFDEWFERVNRLLANAPEEPKP